MASNEEIKNILSNLEISADQAGVYLALLQLGEGSYTEISKATGIKRTTLYAIIDKMERRGLVKKSLDKKSFEPTSPHQVFEKLQKNNLIFYHALPLFQALTKKSSKPIKVKFYNGTKGIQQLFLDELEIWKKSKEGTARILSGAAFYHDDPEFKNQYAIQRQKMGFDTRMIVSFDHNKYKDKYTEQFKTMKIKYLPEKIGNLTGRIAASSSRVTLIGFLDDKSGLAIDSKELADTFIKFFDYVWSLMK